MKKIIVVEDDKTIILGLEYSLQQEGYAIESCHDVKTACQLVKTNTYDLAILDLSLPDGTGYDICRTIREQSNMPVIFLTACDDEVNVVMALDMGADDYITKPFRIRELMSRIRSVLRRVEKNASNEQEIRIGTITIASKQAKVFRDDKEIQLTALEYRLLLTLATHEGQVLSRNQLLEGIWDIAGDFVNDNTLTVYIKRLREKIEDAPHNPTIIKTIRGLGYKAGD